MPTNVSSIVKHQLMFASLQLDLWKLAILVIAIPFLLYHALSIFLRYFGKAAFNSKPPLPPGPPAKFLLGNILDMPTHQHSETITGWGNEYGDLVHIEILGKHIIFINSYDVAIELLEKRSAITSDRIEFTMLNDLMGFHWGLPAMRYGDRWRLHRKIFHQEFNSNAVSKFHGTQIKQTHALAQKLRKSPEDFHQHFMHFSCATIIETTYGINILPQNDPLVEIAEKAMVGVRTAAMPGSFIVDILPFLKHIPEWVPGAGIQKKARSWRKSLLEMVEIPYDISKKAFATGHYPISFSSAWLERLDHSKGLSDTPEIETAVKNVAGTAYLGGFETLTSALLTFVLAMALHPNAQSKAHEELDRVIGATRLPDFTDRLDLPYVNALCKELLRWKPAAPLGFSHCTTEDDVYNGLHIPKGAILIANQQAILLEEEHYGSSSESFEPERFLDTAIKDPAPAFGFGRRHISEDSLFMVVSTILHLYRIGKAKDQQGNEVPISGQFTSGLVVRPESFQCSIEPRCDATDFLLESLTEV